MKQLDLIFEEIYGNLATVYFQGRMFKDALNFLDSIKEKNQLKD